MLLLALSLAPGVALMSFFYLRDRYDREPLRLVITCFVCGALAVLPVLMVEWLLTSVGRMFIKTALEAIVWRAFVVAAATEELAKYFVARDVAISRPEFNEPMDGIVYAVAAALGLATVENVMYIFGSHGGLGVGLVRAVLSVPGHALYAVAIGYGLGMARFATPARGRALVAGGVLTAIALHGLFDFLLFTGKASLALLVIPLSVWLWVSALRRIRRAEDASPFRTGQAPPAE